MIILNLTTSIFLVLIVSAGNFHSISLYIITIYMLLVAVPRPDIAHFAKRAKYFKHAAKSLPEHFLFKCFYFTYFTK